MSFHVRIEVFCLVSKADAIMSAAHLGQPEGGILAVFPVDQLFRIRTKSEYSTDVAA